MSSITPSDARSKKASSQVPTKATSKQGGKANSKAVAPKVSVDSEHFLKLLHPDGLFEIRALMPRPDGSKRVMSGYFNDYAAAVKAIGKIEGKKPSGIYVNLNSLVPDLPTDDRNEWRRYPNPTTSDELIERRCHLLIDIDPVRAPETSSTDEELGAAKLVSNKIKLWLTAQGWPSPVAMMSGNGGYLIYRIDLPNDQESKHLVKNVLKALAEEFDSDTVKVDRRVFNSSRILKVAGTWARKGEPFAGTESEPRRPHRKAYFLVPSSQLKVVQKDLLAKIAALAKLDSSPATKGSRKLTRPVRSGKQSKSIALTNAAPGTDAASLPDASPDVLERCEKYVAKMPPAISGEDGSGRAFSVACTLARFGLSRDQANDAMDTYNQRCVPPWSPSELDHKLDDAYQRVSDEGELGRFTSTSGEPESERRLPIASATQRPVVQWQSGKVHEVVDLICESLGKTGRIFVGPTNELVEIGVERGLVPIGRDAMATRVTEHVQLQRPNAKKVLADIDCTRELAQQVFSNQQWKGIPRIKAVSQQPTITPGGRIVQRPGLDPESGIYVASVPFDWEPIPDSVDELTAERSVESLCEIVNEYQFTRGDLGFSGWISLVLTAVARPAIEGPTPMFVTEAQHPAAGKSMFLDLASIIASGECVDMVVRGSSEENQKLIISTIRQGKTWLVFDNEKQGCVFACPVIASALTKRRVLGRILGVSKNVSAPNRLLFCASGNQLMFSTEIARRTLLIEIDYQPGRSFTKTDLRKWVRENRVRLLRDALIVLRYGLSQPRIERRPLETYEEWSAMIRDTILTMEMPDPNDLVNAAKQKDADEESDGMLIEAFIDLIHAAQDNQKAKSPACPREQYCGAKAIAGQARLAIREFQRTGDNGQLTSLCTSAWILARRCGKPAANSCNFDPIVIGKRLAALTNREVNGKRIVRGGKHKHYRVEDASGNPV